MIASHGLGHLPERRRGEGGALSPFLCFVRRNHEREREREREREMKKKVI